MQLRSAPGPGIAKSCIASEGYQEGTAGLGDSIRVALKPVAPLQNQTATPKIGIRESLLWMHSAEDGFAAVIPSPVWASAQFMRWPRNPMILRQSTRVGITAASSSFVSGLSRTAITLIVQDQRRFCFGNTLTLVPYGNALAVVRSLLVLSCPAHRRREFGMTSGIQVQWGYLFGFTLGICLGGCEPQPNVELGKRIFEDQNLSANRNQACASCHSRDTGGTGADSIINAQGAVYEGSVKGRFGNRKPPASTYATLAPLFAYDSVMGFVGGNFWDGRATGWKLGSPAADQAQGPFLNPVEQAVPSVKALVARVCNGEYGGLFRRVWGTSVCDDDDQAYASIALSIADFEDARETNQFSSKYDLARIGRAKLTDLEAHGLELFKGQANCSQCHTLEGSAAGPLFTDFTFDNLGVPANPENPFYGMDKVPVGGQPINPQGTEWVDVGLAGFLDQLTQDSVWRALPYVTPSLLNMSQETLSSLVPLSRGKQRVPTLRNVDKRPLAGFVKAYGHNGYFKSLQGIVHFYNTRDVLSPCPSLFTEAEALSNNCWPLAEVTENLNKVAVGDLKLSASDEEAIVAFLKTLSDGWFDQKR